MSNDAEIELATAGGGRLTMTQLQFAAIDPEGAQTVGDLYDSLPPGEWVKMPELGIRVRRWTEE